MMNWMWSLCMSCLEQTPGRCSFRNTTCTLYRGGIIELGSEGSNITVVWVGKAGECFRCHCERQHCSEEFPLSEWFFCLRSDEYLWPPVRLIWECRRWRGPSIQFSPAHLYFIDGKTRLREVNCLSEWIKSRGNKTFTLCRFKFKSSTWHILKHPFHYGLGYSANQILAPNVSNPQSLLSLNTTSQTAQ